eukprot:m.523529 g.523529  ORF g.523529 m.523529 type:complete len:204 (-) comp21977_c1_seq18:2796-3407(-)
MGILQIVWKLSCRHIGSVPTVRMKSLPFSGTCRMQNGAGVFQGLCSTSSPSDVPRPSVPKTRDDFLSMYNFTMTKKVEFEDIDAMQHVNNTRYFRWFESIRIRHFAHAIDAKFSFDPAGIKPVVADTWCRFRMPLDLYDTVEIGARVIEIDQPRGEFKHEYVVWSESFQKAAAVGGCTIVVVDYDTGGKRTAIPEDWLGMLQG